MALAQETPILLLDEPTTYLDLSHQLDVLDLCRSLHIEGRTLVAVLHDLNQSARYATHLIAMKAGEIVAAGDPADGGHRAAGAGDLRRAGADHRGPGDGLTPGHPEGRPAHHATTL